MNDKLKRLWATKTRDDEWWSSFVTAPLAIAVNYGAVDIPWITPNRLTAASFLVAIVATFAILIGGAAFFIAAAILIQKTFRAHNGRRKYLLMRTGYMRMQALIRSSSTSASSSPPSS